MNELTQERIDQHRLALNFLQELRTTGTWFPFPDIDEDAITFSFNPYQLPTEAWALDAEGRNLAVVERFRAAARTIGGRWEKNDPTKSYFDDLYYTFTSVARVGDAAIVLRMDRDVICERVQVGTKKVVKPAVEAQPEQEIDEPIYERECKPLFRATEEALDEGMRELNAAGTESEDAEVLA